MTNNTSVPLVPVKLIERLRAWSNEPDDEPPLKIMQEAAASLETLSREIERLTAERDADLNALRAAVERRVLEKAAKAVEGLSIFGNYTEGNFMRLEAAKAIRNLTTGSGAGEGTEAE